MRAWAWWVVLLGAAPVPSPEVETPVEVSPAVVVPAETGEERLARALSALVEGDYKSAMLLATPGIALYPELASSFRAILDVAVDQSTRTDAFVTPSDTPYATPGEYPYGGRVRYYERPPVPPKEFHVRSGLELGFPTGFRGELEFGGAGLHGLGVRAGVNGLLYGGGPLVVGDTSVYADFAGRRGGRWQTELSMGIVWYGIYPYGQLGVAAQYDPRTPLLVNVGASVTGAGFAPDVTVGFVW